MELTEKILIITLCLKNTGELSEVLKSIESLDAFALLNRAITSTKHIHHPIEWKGISYVDKGDVNT